MSLTKITIVDSIMGSGKTTWAIEFMKSHPNNKFLYVTPYLDECKRIIKGTSPDRKFVEPIVKWPKLSKLINITELIANGLDIAASHELFKRFDDNLVNLLNVTGDKYILIIDEILDVVVPTKCTPLDVKTLLGHAITVDENGSCYWNEEFNETAPYSINQYRYNDIRELALSNNLVTANSYLLWRYNPQIFNLFDHVYVMTYLFDGGIMKGYFEYYNIQYEKMTIDNGNLIPYREQDTTVYRDLINIYIGRLNDPFNKTALSKNWFITKSNHELIIQLRQNMDNYFRHIVEAKTKTRMWSTYKDIRHKIETIRYQNNFIACNARATNDFADRYNLAYLVNININPGVIAYLSKRNIKVDQDLYSLAMMLQWIWRSRIRNNKPINLYLPSYRMRKILFEWMGVDIKKVEAEAAKDI